MKDSIITTGDIYTTHYDYTDTTDTWMETIISIRSINGWFILWSFDSDVDIREDGNRIVVGADAFKSGSTKNVGEVSVYEYTAGDWIQLGLSLSGDIQHEKVGQSVSMSGDGNNVAVSSPGAGNVACVGIKNGRVQY